MTGLYSHHATSKQFPLEVDREEEQTKLSKGRPRNGTRVTFETQDEMNSLIGI